MLLLAKCGPQLELAEGASPGEHGRHVVSTAVEARASSMNDIEHSGCHKVVHATWFESPFSMSKTEMINSGSRTSAAHLKKLGSLPPVGFKLLIIL